MPKKTQTNNTITNETITKETITKERFSYLSDPVFVSIFESYLTNRKKKATDHARELILKDLHKVSRAEAIAMLEQSIKQGWIGIFPLKKENDNGKNINSNRKSSEYSGLEKEIKI